MTNEQVQMIRAMRGEGYAIVIFTAEELEGAAPGDVEDRLVELGWDVIDAFRTEPSDADDGQTGLTEPLTDDLDTEGGEGSRFYVEYIAEGSRDCETFTCLADDAAHAKEQAADAYPSATLLEAYPEEEWIRMGFEPVDAEEQSGQTGLTEEEA